MTKPATVESPPKPIHATGMTHSGATVSRGYHAIGPSGQLILARPGAPLKAGWRLATQADIDAATAAESARRAKDKTGEHEDRDRQSARAGAKASALETNDRKSKDPLAGPE